jgi:hypothetical protein
MKRTFAVVLVAALCAALFGVDGPSWAAQNDAARRAARRQAVAKRLATIKINSVVKIERYDGTKLEGLLWAKTADDVTVDVYRRRAFRRVQFVSRDTIHLDDLKDIKNPLSGPKKAAIAAAVTAGVLLGTCAIAVSQYQASNSPEATPPETEINHDGSREGPPIFIDGP